MPELKDAGVNVTPLIDVVMCMIIFFMLVARIGVSTGADPTIDIPQTILGGKIDDIGNALTLNIKPGKNDLPAVSALVNGEFHDLSLAPDPSSHKAESLLAVLTDLHERNRDIKIIIRADKEMAYRYLEPVLLVCSQAGVSNINFNTRLATADQ